jgi:very-short-patch-repair endonuclease
VIEVDGSIHLLEQNQKLDKLRQNNLEHLGLTVFRFTNTQIRHDVDGVLDKIEEFINSRKHHF